MPNRHRIFRNAIIASGFFGVGCFTGYAAGVYREQKVSSNPQHAISVLQSQPQLTWRFRHFSAGKFTNGARDGGWLSLYKPRFTGAAGYVVFNEVKTKETYILLTVQERIINKQKVLVCEPPIGFFNGEYISPRPHVVTESAEREIEKQIKQGNANVNYKAAYEYFSQQYQAGKLPQEEYITDAHTRNTLFREMKEEAGLDILALQHDKTITVTDKVIDTTENNDVCCVVYHVNISGDELPALLKKDNDEVIHNEWINVKDIDMAKNVVKTSKGEFSLKPYDRVIENVAKVLGEKTDVPRHQLR